MKLPLPVRRIVRQKARARLNVAVEVIPGGQEPKLCGECGYYTTKSGKTRVTYALAHGYAVYHQSTERVQVGKGWLWRRFPGFMARVVMGSRYE